MLRRCQNLIIVQNRSDLRTRLRYRSLTSGPSKTHATRPKLRKSVPHKIVQRSGTISAGRKVDAGRDETRQSNSLTASNTSSLGTKSLDKAPDVTVKSLLERMSGDPLNIKAQNPLDSALASDQIFGAPLKDDMVSSLGKPPRDPNAYDNESYQQYRSLLDEVLAATSFTANYPEQMRRSVIEWLHASTKTVEVRLPSLDNALEHGLGTFQDEVDFNNRATLFQNELKVQRDLFSDQTGINEIPLNTITGVMAHIGRVCAKRARSLPLEVAWAKCKEAGLEIPMKMLVNYLHVVSSYPGRANNSLLTNMQSLSMFDGKQHENHLSNEPDANTNTDDAVNNIRAEIAFFHDLLYKPSEKSLTIRVKFLVSQGKTAEAEALLEESKDTSTEGMKQRTCLPILKQYLEQRNITAALKLFSKMKNLPTVLLNDENYVQLIAAIAEAGFFSPSAAPIEGAVDCGYDPGYGPRLFDQLANEMAERLVEISSVSARRLYNALEFGFRGTSLAKKTERLPPLSPIQSIYSPALPGELIVNRVNVNRQTGACPRSGVTLRLLEFMTGQKEEFRTRLYKLGQENNETFQKLKHKSDNARIITNRQNPMKTFVNWLSNQTGKPYTVIVDGGNVAYHMQNSDKGKFNYHQIQFMVSSLEKLHEKPLVLLPWRYTYDNVHLNSSVFGEGQVQVLTTEEKMIRDRLLLEQKAYKVAAGWHHDLFLMIGSLCDQVNARKGMDLTVEPDNPQKRWPGIRPVLITNDQFRDNWTNVLDGRLFSRWYSSCVVNYKFVGFYDNECANDHISFSPGKFFSREIQCNTLSSAQGDETVWHFPVSDWKNDGWFCVKIPN